MMKEDLGELFKKYMEEVSPQERKLSLVDEFTALFEFVKWSRETEQIEVILACIEMVAFQVSALNQENKTKKLRSKNNAEMMLIHSHISKILKSFHNGG